MGCGQLLVAPRRKSCRSPPRAVANRDACSYACACELAEPIRNLLSIVQRKVVTPNDFTSLRELEDRLLAFQARYEGTATPFHWTFTRADLGELLAKLKAKDGEDARVFAGFHFWNSGLTGSRLGRDVARFVAARCSGARLTEDGLNDRQARADPSTPPRTLADSKLGSVTGVSAAM